MCLRCCKDWDCTVHSNSSGASSQATLDDDNPVVGNGQGNRVTGRPILYDESVPRSTSLGRQSSSHFTRKRQTTIHTHVWKLAHTRVEYPAHPRARRRLVVWYTTALVPVPHARSVCSVLLYNLDVRGSRLCERPSRIRLGGWMDLLLLGFVDTVRQIWENESNSKSSYAPLSAWIQESRHPAQCCRKSERERALWNDSLFQGAGEQGHD